MTIPAGTLVPRDARDFGNYQLLAKLATGGMAEIFLARPTRSEVQQDVLVLKRILPHLAEDEHFVTMFRDEADLASKLVHKNVCQVMSFGQFAGTWFIAMEYLHGVPLSRMMTRLSKAGKMLDARLVAGIIVQACDGLHSAHEARGPDGQLMGVVHRDVSPPNIMVCADGSVKLLDFGIAKARGANSRTRTGTVKGKNAYMSPEQILGKPLDRRSDIFALAVVMYEMLSIKRLFHRESDFMTFKAITEEPIPDIRERRPDLPAALRAALIQGMARDPAGRFDSAQAFAQAIRTALAPVGGPATPSDLARLLSTDFGDEMSARDEILKAADDPNAAASAAPSGAPASRPTFETAARRPLPRSGELSQPPPPIRREQSNPSQAIPSMVIGTPSGKMQAATAATAEIPAVNRTPALPQRRPSTSPPPLPGTPGLGVPIPPAPRAPIMPMPAAPRAPIAPIAPPTGSLQSPPLVQAQAPSMTKSAASYVKPDAKPDRKIDPTRSSGEVPDLSSRMPVDNWLDDPTTDILRAHRIRSLRNLAIAGVALVAIGIAAYFVVPRLMSDDSAPVVIAPTKPVPALVVDARAPEAVVVDALNDHDQIVALSHFGFYTVDANAPTHILIDGKPVGDTPLTPPYPLPPGPHVVRALGPKGKTKDIKIVIYAGQVQTGESIAW